MFDALVFFTTIIFIFTIFQNKNKIIAPSFLFVFPFFVAIIIALFNYKNFYLDSFNALTVLVVSLGLIFFVLGTFCGNVFNHKKQNLKLNKNIVNITKSKLIFTFTLEIFGSLMYLFAMIKWGQDRGLSLSEAIYQSMYNSKFNTGNSSLDLPFYLNSLLIFGKAVCYTCMVFISQNIVYKNNKNSFLILLNIAVPFFTTFLSGSRGDAMNMFISFIIILCFTYYCKFNWKKNLSFKITFFMIISTVIIGVLFFSLKGLIGREETYGEFLNNEFSTYFGAQIKNLDYYLTNEAFHSNYFGYSTLNGIYDFFSSFLKIKIKDNIPSLQFVFINGQSFGNVYTCFYNYYIDDGLLGVISYSFISGLIAQICFNMAKKNDNKKINEWLILYSLIGCNLIFCFFGSRFYSNIISIGFIRQIIWIYFTKWFFTKFSFSFNYKIKQSL